LRFDTMHSRGLPHVLVARRAHQTVKLIDNLTVFHLYNTDRTHAGVSCSSEFKIYCCKGHPLLLFVVKFTKITFFFFPLGRVNPRNRWSIKVAFDTPLYRVVTLKSLEYRKFLGLQP